MSAADAWHTGTGPERREAALLTLETVRTEALRLVRQRLEALYAERQQAHGPERAHVSADDAGRIWSQILDRQELPGAGRISRAFLGCVFRDGTWEFTGTYQQSSQPKNHARLLRQWRKKGVPCSSS